MKKLVLALLSVTTLVANAQHQLDKIWATDTIVAIPESVLPDFKKGILYVSLIDGGGWDVDGKGGVARLSLDGKKYEGTWITGLNAPKGLGLYGNHLYAADISEVVVIDVANGKVEKKIPIEGANGLNDITVADDGTVYVSDSRTAKVWKIQNDQPSLFLDSMQGVNGLKAIGNDVYVLSGRKFVKADQSKKITKLADLEQGGDGIEPVGNGDFIVTSWGGWIYYVHSDGKVETLLDTHLDKKNTADIAYDPVKKIIYVPTFNAKTVVAYQLR
jgi:sugar lactone lactonase YvrE